MGNMQYCPELKFNFNYILPIDDQSLFFEKTVFTNDDLNYELIEEQLKIELLSKYSSFDIKKIEYGCIPMGYFNENMNNMAMLFIWAPFKCYCGSRRGTTIKNL